MCLCLQQCAHWGSVGRCNPTAVCVVFTVWCVQYCWLCVLCWAAKPGWLVLLRLKEGLLGSWRHDIVIGGVGCCLSLLLLWCLAIHNEPSWALKHGLRACC